MGCQSPLIAVNPHACVGPVLPQGRKAKCQVQEGALTSHQMPEPTLKNDKNIQTAIFLTSCPVRGRNPPGSDRIAKLREMTN